MKSHAVGIYYFGMTADSSKVKSTFAFLYEIFHLAAPTVILDDLVRFHIHVCNNKGVHMRQLTVWLFNLENHAPWIISIFVRHSIRHEKTNSFLEEANYHG